MPGPLVFVFLLVFSLTPCFSQKLVINEVLASNGSGVEDDDGDTVPWIELFNAGEETVNLEGFGLSDDYDNPFRWVFPDVAIEPGAFLLVWASGKDRDDPVADLHTNFRVSQDGEEVILTLPDSTRLDEMEPTPMPTDISYGRKPDGADHWYFFSEPTPGGPNITDGYHGILEPPVFSRSGGFFQNDFNLDIQHPDTAVTIIYTTDGSEPCIDNLEGTTYFYKNQYPFYPDSPFGDTLSQAFTSYVYGQPIVIEDRSPHPDKISLISSTVHDPYYFPEEPVFKGTVIRARAYQDQMIPSEITTHTYFVTPHSSNRFSLPVLSISVQEDLLFDYEQGIYVPGLDADQWRLDNPNEPFSWPFRGNFRREGIDWEYPAHIELFEKPSMQRAMGRNIGLRIHGGASRSFPMKSFRLYARNQYTSSHLEYPFFESRPDDKYKRLILRNSGNDFPTTIWEPQYNSRTMFRDAAIQAIVQHMNFGTQAYQPFILFINGEYWGLINARERIDKYYLERVYGADPENIDLLTSRSGVKEGDNLHYLKTISYIEDHGLAEDVHYDYIQTRIDTESFMDYQIAQIYADNTDWPGNNIDFWRLRTDEYQPDAPYGHDGRWRWLMFDMDFGFGLWDREGSYQHNMLEFATDDDGPGWPNPPWSTFLLRSFLENESFLHGFINRFADQLNTAFLPERVVSVIYDMKNTIAPEVRDHYARWGWPAEQEEWEEKVEVMVEFAEKRPHYQKQHIKDFFELEGTYRLDLDVSNPLKGHIRINTIEIKPSTPGVSDDPYPWTGIYFKEIPIELEAIPVPGYRFSHWEGASNSSSALIELTPGENIQLKAHFERLTHHVLLHYWLLDTSIPNNTPLENLDPFYSIYHGAQLTYQSCLEGYPFEEGHPLWRKASMERRNQPTPINYRPEGNQDQDYDETPMRGLQVRQPFRQNEKENTMIFHLPTRGFSDIVFGFAAMDEGAADKLLVDYALDARDPQWIQYGLKSGEFELEDDYQLYSLDFSGIPGVSSNPHFSIRIRFVGEQMEQDEGERVTFNNITLDGIALGAHMIRSSAGPNGEITPRGRVPVYDGGKPDFTIIPNKNHQVSEILVDGQSVPESHWTFQGDTVIYEFPEVHSDHHIHASFFLHPDLFEEHDEQVLVYPNPASSRVNIAAMEEIQRIQLVTLSGNVLQGFEGLSGKEYSFSTRALPQGMYILIIQTQSRTVSRKLQIMR